MMAKFSRHQKLHKNKIREIVTDLCSAVAFAKTPPEAAELLTDLLGRQEFEMIARRLRVAEMLLDGLTYDDISKDLKISTTTIARVQVWLHQSGEGYRKIIERMKKVRKTKLRNEQVFKPTGIKRKYPLYYWPQIILNYWASSSTKDQKEGMLKILAKVNGKSKAFKDLEMQLRQNIL